VSAAVGRIGPCAPTVVRRRVKWGECDPAGVVYTPRFADYVVEAYLAFFESRFGAPPRERLAPLNLGMPAKALSIVFKQSLWPDQMFEMSVEVAEVRTRTFDLRVVGSVDERVAFDAIISLICIETELRQARPLPDFVREELVRGREQQELP
jgi:acyl-CoA thioester hydrolase